MLSDLERAAVAGGADVYVTQLTGGGPLQPLDVRTTPPPVRA